jgi:hypothetical protein
MLYIAPQFSIFMVNKPGVLAQILSEFAKAKINISAVTMMDSAEHGVMRIIFGNPDKAREVLSRLNMQFSETEVLCVNLDNKAGSLASVAEKLSLSHINISYAYCTTGAPGGKATGVLKVADVKKAVKVLDKTGKKVAKSKPTVRRSQASRK